MISKPTKPSLPSDDVNIPVEDLPVGQEGIAVVFPISNDSRVQNPRQPVGKPIPPNNGKVR